MTGRELLLLRVGTRSSGTRSTMAHRSAAVADRWLMQRMRVLVGGSCRVEADTPRGRGAEPKKGDGGMEPASPALSPASLCAEDTPKKWSLVPLTVR